MKLNLDYYQSDLVYNQYKNEEQIISDYIQTTPNEEYNDIFTKDESIDTILALSDMRKNIVSWYPFIPNGSILEIGAGLGEITGALCQRANRVVSIEFSKKRGEAIVKRHKNRKNLEVIVGALKDIQLDEKFDYVTLIGILKYAKKLNTTQEEIITYAKSQLKENGVILIAEENPLGMQYWSKINANGEFVGNYLEEKQMLTLQETKDLLKKCELNNNKFYYVQPDIKLANVIFADDYLPDEENMTRNIVYGNEEDIKFCDQIHVYKQIAKEKDLFPVFANAFMCEISLGEKVNNEIKMVCFSNMRKTEHRIKTIINEKEVHKYEANGKATKHIDAIKKNIDIMKKIGLNTLDSYDEEKIISQFSKEKTLDKLIIEMLKKDKKEQMIELLKKYQEELSDKLEIVDDIKNNVFDKYNIEYEPAEMENLHFVKYGLWDLVFQNCFYINEKFYFYDQEWLEEKIPVEFILYRAVVYFSQLQKFINVTEIYEKMNLSEQQVSLLKKLDNSIQEKIRNNKMWKIHRQGDTVIDLKRKQLTAQHEKNLLFLENEQLKQEIKRVSNENKQLAKDLQQITNSKLWKIAEKIRKLKQKNKE